MGISEMQRLAVALGIKDANRMNADTLIRCVQFQEGHMPCFSEVWSAPCRIDGCPFSDGCSSHVPAREAVKH